MRNFRDTARREGWGPPFPDDEYKKRLGRVVEQMANVGIDTLLVTSPANINYLTGYDMIWYYSRTPSAVAIRREPISSLFFVLAYHRPTVEYHAVVDELTCFDSFHDADKFIVDELVRRSWHDGKVGIEFWSKNPNGQVLQSITSGLEYSGTEIVDASWLVDNVKLIKSAAECQAMHEAAKIADDAMLSVASELKSGMTEISIAGRILHQMMENGGGDPAIRVAVRSGPRFLARHCAPSLRKIQFGDLVWLNFCGSFHRYHSDLGRLVSIGEPDYRWTKLIDTAADIAADVLAGVKADEPTQKLQDSVEAAAERFGLSQQAVLLGGYDMGIAIPPDWVGHTFTNSERGFVKADYVVGMCTNFEMLFRGQDDWRGGAGGGFIATVVMTPTGLEVLSKIKRSILIAGE